MMSNKTRLAAFVGIFLMIATYLYLRSISRAMTGGYKSYDVGMFKLEKNDCSLLFKKAPYSSFNLSKAYYERITEFDQAAKKHMPNGKYIDGYTSLFQEKLKAIHYMAQAPYVRTVCETGFNYGHSSFNYLTANPSLVVHSFDIGYHPYSKVMHEKLKEMFPGRIELHLGDSKLAIPKYITENPNFQCDLALVDGAHRYAEGKSDLENFIKVINKKSNVIFVDDHPAINSADYGRCWDELVAKGVVKDIFRCSFYQGASPVYGFLAGTAVQKE